MPINPTRQDTYNVEVKIAGSDTGTWDKMTGGEVDSDDNKYYPGNMQEPISLGGRRTTGNLVISRLYRLQRDHDNLQDWINAVGSGEVVVKKHVLNIHNSNKAYNPPVVYTGILKRVTPPEVDSESSTAGIIEIEVTISGFPTSH